MKEQDIVNKERLALINNNERRMIVRALGLLETALNIEEDVCSNDYKRSVRELAHTFCEENWTFKHYTNAHKVKPLD